MKYLAILLLLGLLLIPSTQAQTVSYGTTNIKLLATSVQNAVDNSTDGTIIFMSTGTFYETVIVNNKDIRFEGGWDDNHSTRTFGYTAIDGSSTGRPITFLASSSQVDYVSFIHGGGLLNFWGGGVLVQDGSWVSLNSSPICSNISLWAGGGLYVDSNAYSIVTGTSPICSNVAFATIGPDGAYGGGAFVNEDGRLDIVSDADIYDNVVVDGQGGGIWVRPNGYLRLFQADVMDNIALTGAINSISGGGGVGVQQAFAEIGDSCVIAGNIADLGGGLLLSEAVANLGRGRQYDLTVEGNMAFSGGGLYALQSRISSSGTVWNGNNADGNGGGILVWGCRFESDTNQIVFTSNTAGDSGGGMYSSVSTCTLQTAVFGEDTNSGNQAWAHGGGLVVNDSRFIIKGGMFGGNRTAHPTDGYGGAIAVWDSTLTLTNGPGSFGMYENVTLISNRSVFGGAAHVTNSTLRTYDCDFVANYAVSNGGAIYSHIGSPLLNGTLFEQNLAGEHGGALYGASGDQSLMYNCQFIGNVATGSGGAIYFLDGFQLGIFGQSPPYYSPPNSWANLFEANDAQGGGAVASYNTPTVIQDAAFLRNTGHYAIVSIVGTYGVSSLTSPHIDMSSSLIAENHESGGIGMISLDVNATGIVSGCTIASNDSPGIRIDDTGSESTMVISNCIIWGNWLASISNRSIVTVDYSDIEGNWTGTGNVDTNPVFFSNYHLQHSSPCRNAGAPVGGLDYDIDGEQRVGNFDMGCDEFIDSDGDNLPNMIETGTGIWVSDIDTGSQLGTEHSDADDSDDGEEWIADTNPNDPTSYLHIDNIWLPSGQAAPRFSTVNGTNAYLEIDYTMNCVTGEWINSVTFPPPNNGTNSFGLTPGDISFIRLRARR